MGQHIYTGTLYLDTSGRYCLCEASKPDPQDITFTSGQSIELWIAKQWVKGRVEHARSRGGYYFTDGEGWLALHEGMKARYLYQW